jgi:outer membrane protein OmpA-like peptidoglycan-associated protein/tetratricopeptide (TPR) repeat protein
MKQSTPIRKTVQLTLLMLCTVFQHTIAQWYNPEKVSKKVADLYNQAYNDASEGRYAEAIAGVKKCISIDNRFVDGYLTRAGIYADQRKYDSSVRDFEKALDLDSVYSRQYRLPYSISLAGTGQFEKALGQVNRFLEDPSLNEQSKKAGAYRRSVYAFALEHAGRHPQGNYVFAPVNLGDSINSPLPEYYPSITIDGQKLIYTRRQARDEDFFESRLLNGSWSGSQPLEGKVNTNLNEGAQNISQDGEWIVFTGCNYPEGEGSCDLYISYKTKNGWSEPVNLGAAINTTAWESAPSLSPDKRDLYFSSNRPGGFGGKDIWVTHRNEKGRWSQPENLGATINTEGEESCPFMYADNQTLFFNSSGHQGYGATDLFFAKKDSTGEDWTRPENLGYPINTIDDEGSLIVAADGKTAYYASERSDSRGALDLYRFLLPDDMRPPATFWVKGRVYDAKTREGLPSTVELTDLNTRRIISRLQTDELGNYLTTLPVGSQYLFNVNRKGYLFFSENYRLEREQTDSFFTADIPLQPIEPGAVIVLKNIFFETNKSTLNPASRIELDKVVQLMTDNPTMKILISGHTDNVGKAADNTKLSLDRAQAVVNYLLGSQKIAKERLTAKGWGAAKPIAENSTESGRARNRRTELEVTGN